MTFEPFFLDTLYPLLARYFRMVAVVPQNISFRFLAKVSPKMVGGFLNPWGRTLQQYCCFFLLCVWVLPLKRKNSLFSSAGRRRSSYWWDTAMPLKDSDLSAEHSISAHGLPSCLELWCHGQNCWVQSSCHPRNASLKNWVQDLCLQHPTRE